VVHAAEKPQLIRLLLVEDNRDEIDLCLSLLPAVARELGVEIKIEVARNGEQALAALNTLPAERPHLVLLDLRMPIMGGHEFLERLRESEKLKRQAVCVLTTSPDKVDICRAYDAFCNSYVIKPLGASELQRVLREILHFFLQTSTPPSHDRH
jgi:two-component system response regulator